MQWSSLIVQLYYIYIISYHIYTYIYTYICMTQERGNVEGFKTSLLQLSPGSQVAYVSGAPGPSLGAWQSCCTRTQRQACKAWLLMVWMLENFIEKRGGKWLKLAEWIRTHSQIYCLWPPTWMQPGCPYPFASFCHGCLTHPQHFIQSCFTSPQLWRCGRRYHR